MLAHPLRSRLLSALRTDGTATATALAKKLSSTNTGATSYHLRKLAEVALVEETGAGRGRERWWRAAHDMHSWIPSDFDDDADASAALNWLEAHYAREHARRLQEWLTSQQDWSAQWRDTSGMSDALLRLSPSQARQLQEELLEVIARWRAAEPGEGAERVQLNLSAFPFRREGDGP